MHAAGNLMNTLFDYRNGYDGAGSSDQTLVSGAMAPAQAARLVGVSYGIAALCLAPLALLSSAPAWQLALSAAAGAASAYVYTGGPGLKYKALGDVLITATFGPLLVRARLGPPCGPTGPPRTHSPNTAGGLLLPRPVSRLPGRARAAAGARARRAHRGHPTRQ